MQQRHLPTARMTMRKRGLQIVAVLLAVCFVWAGSGVNYVRYCCNDCRQAGIEHILNHACDHVHHNDGGQTPCRNAGACQHADGCTLLRLHLSDGGICSTVHIPPVMAFEIPALPAMEETITLLTTPQTPAASPHCTAHTPPLSGRRVSIQHQLFLL